MMDHPKMVLGIALRFYINGVLQGAGRRYVQYVNRASVIGLTLGTAALIMVVAVMNGFDRELQSRLLSVTPHLLVSGEIPREQLLSQDNVRQVQPYLSAEVLLLADQGGLLFRLQGLAPDDHQVTIMQAALQKGRWWTKQDAAPIILGAPLVERFGYRLGQSIPVALIKIDPETHRIQPRVSSFVLIGTYALGAETDQAIAITSLSALATVLNLSPTQRVHLKDPMAVQRVREDLISSGITPLSSWEHEFGAFFQAVQLEKLMMGLLLSVLIGLALISLSAGMRIVMLEKQQTIIILMTLGLTAKDCRYVFLIQSALLSVTGIAIGLLLGVLIASQLPALMACIEDLTGFSIVTGSYFSDLPVDIRLWDTALIIISALLACACVMWRLVQSNFRLAQDPARTNSPPAGL
ncbi:ABC transporter permease [Pseudomonadales bacterium]|nr:ABC transporter permease [Pseudomonadales bacterium]